MTVYTGIIIGLIAGWLIEWLIDWQFWRKGDNNNDAGLQTRFNDTDSRLKQLQLDLTEKQDLLGRAEMEIDDLKAQLSQAFSRAATVIIKEKDDLEDIIGIGPAFARRLNKAGVVTFAELAALSPARIREIIAPAEWQKIEPEYWIEQSLKLAQNRDLEQKENN